ncbi:MAG: fluoride efflux transporter CrcB [Candidatus Omnitrophota bacterium]
MLKILAIALGGAIGSALRYSVSGLVYKASAGIFPAGTLVVNVTGSFLIGVLWALFERFTVAPVVRSFIFVGLLGGYTTFSTFSLENFHLLRDGEYRMALVNILLSNTAGVVFVFAGFLLSRYLTGLVLSAR